MKQKIKYKPIPLEQLEEGVFYAPAEVAYAKKPEPKKVVKPKEPKKIKCKDCGNRRIKTEKCPYCALWAKRLKLVKAKKNRYTYVIVKHAFYENKTTDIQGARGQGGKLFAIKFKDGTAVVSTNLWFLGHIPRKLWQQIPDNAIFTNEE